MASITSSSDRAPQVRNIELTGTGNTKQASCKNLEINRKYNPGDSNSNACEEQELEYTRHKHGLNYDTLDSAYSTSESSYNTVDSTYSQRSNSSGYSTLDLKWKRPQKNLLERNKNSVRQDGYPVAGPIDPDSAATAFGVSSRDPDPIKFVDDPEGSDTATETETDTELTISGCTVDLDMSYVPDYVRPMMAPISVVAMTTTTSSFTTSRPALTSTMTSPSVSVSSSMAASPPGSVKDENIGLSPKVTHYKCGDRTTTYAGYREDYARKQKEKLCGRKSLDERLKSLESGAAVRLQVCKGSQNRRRRPGGREMVSTAKSIYPSTELCSNPRHPINDPEGSSIKQDLQIEPTPTRAPPPDIIESHQPPNVTQEHRSGHGHSDSVDRVKLVRPLEAACSVEPRTIDIRNNETDRFPKPDTRQPIAIKWKAATATLDRKLPHASQQPVTTSSKRNKHEGDRIPDLSDAINDRTPQSPSRTDPVPARLTWKQPSQEALNRLHDVTEQQQNSTVNVLVSSSKQGSREAVGEMEADDGSDGSLQKKEVPKILVDDVNAVDQSATPVELRSPKGEPRGSAKEKTREMHDRRNARMFSGPSSDDSEGDNLLTTKKNPAEQKPVHVAPVKFVPSVLRRSRSRSAKEEEESQTSSTSSLAADVKTSTNEGKPFASPDKPKETRRKSSRSPKRTNSKRSTRSKSTHERPRTETKKHTRTLSGGNHSSVPVTHSIGDQRDRKSPETPVHSNTQRSRDHSSRSSSHNRHKSEYSELSSVPRTPRSHRKFAEPSSLPSPRQLAVAQMVKFGFSGNEGVIPYIDENNSPEEQKKQLVDNSSRLRAASEELFLREADTSTIRKAFPLSRRGRSIKRDECPRRISYMEAMGSSDDLTPDPDTDGSGYAAASADSEHEHATSLGKFGRSNSADSILSTTDARPNVTLRNKHVRASSADRSSVKGVYRRSYQIATTKPAKKPSYNNDLLRPSTHKRQPSIRRLKNFFAENTQQMVESQTDEGRRGSRGRSVGPVPTLTLSEYDDTVVREGFLYFKDSSPVISVNNNSPGSTSPPSQLLLEEEDPLNIQGSLVSIAYNYVKRKNVFKVTTCNGSEYLFQADDRDDMLAWINSIQVSGNHDNKDGEVTVNEDLILRKTNQIESGKTKRNQSDPCILQSVQPLVESESPFWVRQAAISRSTSDPTRHRIGPRANSSSSPNITIHQLTPLSSASTSNSNTLPKTRSAQTLKKGILKRSKSDDVFLQHSDLTNADISLPQPLDLSGIPNGLTEIAVTPAEPSPISRRPKSETFPTEEEESKRNRRKGIVWTQPGSSKPVPPNVDGPLRISQPLELVDGGNVTRRTTEEQQKLLRDLANEQNIKNLKPVSRDRKGKKGKKSKSRSLESLKDPDSKSKSKMADKIQRTIRALYDGSSKRKSASFEKLDEECNSGDELEPLPQKPLTAPQQDSPKPEKRSSRKSRSPKPSRRMTVPIKDIDGSRRFKWRGSVNRIVRKFGQGQTLMQGGTFDVHLEDCPPSVNNELVPSVVELCCRIVEERGLSFIGIYRVPGNSGTLAALQEELNFRGAEAVDLENDERFRELNVVSSLLKSFFRKLPDPLFTNELYDDFITMNRKKDSEERINGLRRLIHMLPAPHYETLKFLVAHLRKVADNFEVNRMEVRNLAIVFGPTLVRSSVCDNMATMVTDMSDQCRIVESVLQHAHWFFSDDENESSGVRNLPVPTDEHHEPVPNIDHLLANVGRTPGDASDSTSESSKSKVSCASEKESFSRDVMEMIFGAGKRWRQNPQQRDTKDAGEESSDDEFGFKEAMRKQAKTAEERPKSPPSIESAPSQTSTFSLTSSTPQKYQVGEPAASGIRAAWPKKGEHFPRDIPARLYDFYVENLERLAQVDTSRPLAHFSSSSPEISPQVTPRGSLFAPFQPPAQRNYSLQVRRSSGGRLRNIVVPGQNDTLRQTSAPAPMSTPLSQKPNASEPNLLYSKNQNRSDPVLVTSTPVRNGAKATAYEPVQSAQNQTEINSVNKIGSHSNEESDSDSSIYVGETLEEKLKNLTNLEKKLERRPSRRQANRHHGILLKLTTPLDTPTQTTNKKLTTAPSLQAGELITPDNLHMYPTKKTTRELYQERKAQRQQQRELVKAKRHNRKDDTMQKCASDENVFNRFDPKRQVLRSSSRDDGNATTRPRQSKEKVKRRHTLGGNDFPPQESWDKTHHASLQNLSPEGPCSAMTRLRPRLRDLASAATSMTPTPRVSAHADGFRPEKGRKTESYI